ncbi:4-hydroxy-3-methylbut-2-enyl diphosphate reductase [[Clostridium] polysaccharolyticum]|uniref:4-hydroxy-3-methylbut-2-enyl diphosphate reductase n=1 Tax=[Clostridium] polysaccharolyticum TaxID=29364 RepID=UPI000AB416C3|nr:4-hydroxy-3-methylbut-2-enyl diphosphate reductase [[Clostridium] polysaccharolyticum]
MEIRTAKSAGFCFGVERAVNRVYEEIKGENAVYTYGPIIHNEEVVRDLKEHGVNVIQNVDDFTEGMPGTVIIRSHGIGKSVQDAMESKGCNVVDATCPYVKKIHRVVSKESQAGRVIIIIGSSRHPEVQGIKGWSENDVYIIETKEDAEKVSLPEGTKVCIVSQTTFNYKKFEELVEIISKKRYDILALNTICNATEIRQNESRELARNSDAMIVIGGEHSSNTQKLYEICKNECKNTYYIQTAEDLNLAELKSFERVGITAGASTPNKIIKEVQKACQK